MSFSGSCMGKEFREMHVGHVTPLTTRSSQTISAELGLCSPRIGNVTTSFSSKSAFAHIVSIQLLYWVPILPLFLCIRSLGRDGPSAAAQLSPFQVRSVLVSVADCRGALAPNLCSGDASFSPSFDSHLSSWLHQKDQPKWCLH